MTIRAIAQDDLPLIATMNDAAYPAVNMLAPDELASLVELSGFSFVVEGDDGEVLGFLIGMLPGSSYASENYVYFNGRGDNFLYVDRIVVAEGSRGQEIGQQLYRAVFELAREQGRTEVDCEVNLDPPNPGSLVFHGRLGFERVGQQETKGGLFTVALLARSMGQPK